MNFTLKTIFASQDINDYLKWKLNSDLRNFLLLFDENKDQILIKRKMNIFDTNIKIYSYIMKIIIAQIIKVKTCWLKVSSNLRFFEFIQ